MDLVRRFASILERFPQKIIIEISGHEHLCDVRYHNGSLFFPQSPLLKNLPRNEQLQYLNFTGPKRYHNMLISPGVTSFDGQNPGYTVMQLNLTSQIAYDLKMTFLPIDKTYNWTMPFPDVMTWPWNVLNFTEYIGINEITPYSIEQLALRLMAN